ncbi:hypothetical protein LshimejAT787_1701010 [Lyophyllum shimeji]|uniref:Uncharacterized protein n=1 Tax=Lyophyllum shimeji TaxID=47721 RepID=A0A9P3PZR1_LYOSH|nr:hypothetical protein LshimejAT787_1701010 [Lyophyllum shimeji]
MPISTLLEYSLPVTAVELCVVWMTVHYILEPYAMPKVFGPTYTEMDIVARRSLTNHVVSFFLKVLCCCGAYAVIEVFIVKRPLDAPVQALHGPHRTITIGDFLAFCYLTVPTIYIFEIIYRANISLVSSIHHVGAITINIMGIIIVLSHGQNGFLAETEFKLILIYGVFEMLFEVFPHVAVILYRLRRDEPAFLRKIFLIASCGIFTGTLLEQVAIGMFYHQIWKRFPTSYKVVGLILHVCFMAAQIHGGRVCLQIAQKMAEEAKAKAQDPEKGELTAGSEVSSLTEVDEDEAVMEPQQVARVPIIIMEGPGANKGMKMGGAAHAATTRTSLDMGIPRDGVVSDADYVREPDRRAARNLKETSREELLDHSSSDKWTGGLAS